MTAVLHAGEGGAAGDRTPGRTYRWSTAVLYALTLTGYPIISFIPTVMGVPSRMASIPFRAGYLVLATIVLLQNIRWRRVYYGPVWFPLGIFWLLYLMRLATDTVFSPIHLMLPPIEYFEWALGTCLIPMMSFLSAPDDETLELAAPAVSRCMRTI